VAQVTSNKVTRNKGTNKMTKKITTLKNEVLEPGYYWLNATVLVDNPSWPRRLECLDLSDLISSMTTVVDDEEPIGFNMQWPIIIDGRGKIYRGHRRKAAAAILGIPVYCQVVPDMTPVEESRFIDDHGQRPLSSLALATLSRDIVLNHAWSVETKALEGKLCTLILSSLTASLGSKVGDSEISLDKAKSRYRGKLQELKALSLVPEFLWCIHVKRMKGEVTAASIPDSYRGKDALWKRAQEYALAVKRKGPKVAAEEFEKKYHETALGFVPKVVTPTVIKTKEIIDLRSALMAENNEVGAAALTELLKIAGIE
jgi:hypothetical protein